jgi:hypothetical protein
MAAAVPCSCASPRVVATQLPGKGRAVLAVAPIRRDEIIAVFGGVIIPLSQALRLTPRQMTQCIQVEDDWVLWSAHLRQTTADWINHSCAPNAGLAGQVTVVAMRDIAAGEEICFDYAMCSSCLLDDFDCRCGTPGCRGHVGPDDWRRADLQRRYRGYFSTFLQRRIACENARAGLDGVTGMAAEYPPRQADTSAGAGPKETPCAPPAPPPSWPRMTAFASPGSTLPPARKPAGTGTGTTM